MNALEAGVFRDHAHDLADEFGGLLVVQWLVLAASPHVVGECVADDDRRVDLEVVRLVVGVREQLPEILQTHLLGHPGLAGHHMEADFEAGIPQPAVGVDRGLIAVTAVHLAVDPLVGRLDADLNLCAPKIEHAVDLLAVTPVGLCLKGGADVADLVGFVFGDHVFEILELVVVGILSEAFAFGRGGWVIEIVIVQGL